MKKNIPNLITAFNLLAGLGGIYFCSKGNLLHASYTVFLAMVFDFLDGLFARALKTSSDFGKQFDSLADLVSFGIVPGFIVLNLLKSQSILEIIIIEKNVLPFIGFLIPLLSAARLAKFNTDTRQVNMFYGLPTPAHALFWASIPVVGSFSAENATIFNTIIVHPAFIVTAVVIFSLMMIVDIPMISLKFKNLKISDNWQRYILVAAIILLFAILKLYAIPFIIVVYVILSLIFAAIKK